MVPMLSGFLRRGAAGALFVPAILDAQQRTVTGKVTEDGTEAPIGNAQIVVRGGSAATVSRENGTFTLVMAQEAAVAK